MCLDLMSIMIFFDTHVLVGRQKVKGDEMHHAWRPMKK